VTSYTRKLLVKHRTEFTYVGSAADSVNEIRLGPVDGPRQSVDYARVVISPNADVAESRDAWGNRVWWCQIVEPHAALRVEAESLVSLRGPDPVDDACDGGWGATEHEQYQEEFTEFLLPSELLAWSETTRAFADELGLATADPPHRWMVGLSRALNRSLSYQRGATDVTTAVDGVIAAGRGVCQDFAHVFVALCRLRGLAARYVSGWMFEDDRSGPVESHAWAEVNIPGIGWVEEDPTHPGEVSDGYVRIGCGRDYADVVPIKGTYLGGVTASMDVRVELQEVPVAWEAVT
jgi:transglutaminase-like putative cysteine protease